jgi:5'(3')-deoxyribonucleotidase
MTKKIVYIDMDNVLVDFQTGIDKLPPETRAQYPGDKDIDDCPGIFSLMEPMPGAIAAFHELEKHFDVYILSTAPWKNPTAWHDKVEWVKTHLDSHEKGSVAYKRLILSHNKNLNRGEFLIDDRLANGAKQFGEIDGQMHIHFDFRNREGARDERFQTWQDVVDFLVPMA